MGKIRRSEGKIPKKRSTRMKHFLESDDPFVDYILEDVYIRKRVGGEAVRANVPDDVDDVIELYSMNEKALKRIHKVLTSGRTVNIVVNKLRRPEPEEYEMFLKDQSKELDDDDDMPQLPW